MVYTCLLNLWVVSSCKICDGMGVRGVGRLGNSAEPLRYQRMQACICCPLRRDVHVMLGSTHTYVQLHSHMNFSCVGTGGIAPGFPAPQRAEV